MAKKLMEVIELNKDLKKSTTKVKLLDTSFTQLTRKIGQDDFGHWLTIGEGDVLSKEALVSLNQSQLAYLPRYQALFNAYNSWIDTTRATIPLIANFIYNFSALYDYSSSYIPYVTPSDYYLLKDIIGAEKELYEAGSYWMTEHMRYNQTVMKTWSQSRYYAKGINKLWGKFRKTNSDSPAITCPAYLSLTTTWIGHTSSEGDVWESYVTGLENMPPNTTAIVQYRRDRTGWRWEITSGPLITSPSGETDVVLTVKLFRIGHDFGWGVASTEILDHKAIYTGNGTPIFTDPQPNFNFLSSTPLAGNKTTTGFYGV